MTIRIFLKAGIVVCLAVCLLGSCVATNVRTGTVMPLTVQKFYYYNIMCVPQASREFVDKFARVYEAGDEYVFVSSPYGKPDYSITGVSKEPIAVDTDAVGLEAFADSFYSRAFCAPHVYSAVRCFSENLKKTDRRRERIQDKLKQVSKERWFLLKDGTFVLVRHCMVKGIWGKAKCLDDIGLDESDYCKHNSRVHVREECYVLKRLIKASASK